MSDVLRAVGSLDIYANGILTIQKQTSALEASLNERKPLCLCRFKKQRLQESVDHG